MHTLHRCVCARLCVTRSEQQQTLSEDVLLYCTILLYAYDCEYTVHRVRYTQMYVVCVLKASRASVSRGDRPTGNPSGVQIYFFIHSGFLISLLLFRIAPPAWPCCRFIRAENCDSTRKILSVISDVFYMQFGHTSLVMCQQSAAIILMIHSV